MPFDKNMIDGPIPGENYTSDTKNYPWHRPPEYTEIDPAIEYISKIMTDERGSMSIISMLEMGINVATITDIIITKGMGKGKWSVDMGLLLAGPVSHIIVLMARGYEVDFNMGLEAVGGVPTEVFFKEAKKVDEKKAKEAGEKAAEQIGTIKDVSGGGSSSESADGPLPGGFMGADRPNPEVGGETGGFA